MSVTEAVVIGLCLLFGYGLVASFLSGSQPRDPAAGRQRQEPRRSRSDAYLEPASAKARSWFEVLAVAETAYRDTIEHAYRIKISQYHPDKVAWLGEDIRQLAESKSKEINAAYDTGLRLLGARR